MAVRIEQGLVTVFSCLEKVGLLGRQSSVPSSWQYSGLTSLQPTNSLTPSLFLLQFLGRFETLIFYWPSLLCLGFLLGRFLHMFLKALPIHLGLESQTVSAER